jgi:hypothetical protein
MQDCSFRHDCCKTSTSAMGHLRRPRGATGLRGMSAMPPIAPELMRWGELTRCAMCGRLRVGKDKLDVCSAGRCSHVFGLLARFP